MKSTRLRLPLVITAAAAALSMASVAHAEHVSEVADSSQGTVGVCVRWGAADDKLAEVVVVEPSGNAMLDSAIPNTLREMPWAKPQGYGGEWVGLSVGVAGSQPSGKVPSCTNLAEEVTGPARPLPTGKLLKA